MSVLLATLALTMIAPGKASFPDGRVVECVQISRSFDGVVENWRPDGTRIAPEKAVPFELNKHTPRLAFLFRAPLTKVSSEPNAGASIAPTSAQQFGVMMFGSDILIAGKKTPGWIYFTVGFADPGSVEKLDLECFLTDGPHIEAIRFAVDEDSERHAKDFPRLKIEDRGEGQSVIYWGAPRSTPVFSASKVIADLKEPVDGRTTVEGMLPGGGKAFVQGFFFASPLSNIKLFHVYRRDTLRCVIKGLPLNPNSR